MLQAGVAELVVQAVEAVQPALAPLLYSNVILTGKAPLQLCVDLLIHV